MKLGIVAGWMAAGILGASIILGQSTASAEFVIDEFATSDGPMDDDSPLGPEAERWVSFSSSASSGLSILFERNITGTYEGFLWYDNVAVEGLRSLRLTEVDNNSGGNMTVTARLLDAPNGVTLGNDVGTMSDSNLDFDVSGTAAVKALEFYFRWEAEVGASGEATSPTGDFTSTSLQAEFETASSSGSPQAVPEPTSLVLFGLASAGGGIAAWRKRRKQTVSSAGGAGVDAEM